MNEYSYFKKVKDELIKTNLFNTSKAKDFVDRNDTWIMELYAQDVSPKDAVGEILEHEMKQPVTYSYLPGGIGDDTQPQDVDPTELEMGVSVEMEHTDNPQIAEEIALDHLTEDSKYYTKLKVIEGHESSSKLLREMASKIAGESEIKNGLVELLSEYMVHASKRINLDVLEGREDVLHLFGLFIDIVHSFSNPDYNTTYKNIKPYMPRDPTPEESAWAKDAIDNKLVTIIKRALQKSWPGLLKLFKGYEIDNRKW